MKRYLGIDMHRESCTVVVLSAGGKKTDQRVVPTEAAALVQYVRSLSGELHICVEEGEWSEWLVELLSARVYRVVSCTARRRRGPRSDAQDARELAERLQTRQTGFTRPTDPCDSDEDRHPPLNLTALYYRRAATERSSIEDECLRMASLGNLILRERGCQVRVRSKL